MSEREMNLVLLGGRLVFEPQLRANRRPVCFMRVSRDIELPTFDSSCGRREELDVIVLGAKARPLARRLNPGRCVILRGSLQMESWEEGEGPEQEAVCVLAKHVEISSSTS